MRELDDAECIVIRPSVVVLLLIVAAALCIGGYELGVLWITRTGG